MKFIRPSRVVTALTLLSLTLTLTAGISNSMASDFSVVGESKSLSIIRKGKDLNPQSTLDATITTKLNRVTTEYVTVDVQVPHVKCTQVAPNYPGNWHGAFEANIFEKAPRLAYAIKGLSHETAVKMVMDGYLKTRPETWEDFCDEINRADSHIEAGLFYKVTVENYNENINNLGYYSEQYCETSYRVERHTKPIQRKTFYKDVSRDFHIVILNGSLLNQEKETLKLTFDGFETRLDVVSDYNHYSVSRPIELGHAVAYELRGARKQVPSVNSLSASPSNQNGELALKITDTAFDRDLGSTNGYAVAEITVWQYRWYWFDKNLGTVEVHLSTTEPDTIAATGIKPEARSSAYATYKLKRVGSNYYSDKASVDYKQTSKVNF